LGGESSDHHDLDVGVEGPQDRRGRRAEGAAAVETRTLPPGGGGCGVTEWSETAKGSARTACSSLRESEMGKSIDSWAGRYSANPPGASREVPVWMPGARGPSVKCQQRLRSPAAHDPHSGVIPRGRHESHGLSTTRCPTSSRETPLPTSATSATTSCPNTVGDEK
jgi:hypothetical protein